MYILVEGHTDKDFFELYCKYLKLNIKKYDIISVNGKDNLKKRVDLVKGNKNYLIVFDADYNYDNSKANIENQISQMNIPKENYDIFLLPNNKDNGDIETLIENIALHKDVLNCFEGYKKCINGLISKNNNIKLPPKKSKVFAYMESFGFKNTIKPKEFDLSPYVNFEDKYLEPLKNFLLSKK